MGMEASAGDRQRRVLVVVAEELIGDELIERIEDSAQGAELRLVAPALTDSGLKHAMGDVDEAMEAAEERVRQSAARLERDGLEVTATVGDADPMLAISDQLATFDADEILIVTRPHDSARWLEGDAFDRATQMFEPPLTHVEIDVDGDGSSAIVDVERSGRGTEPPPRAEVDPDSRNFPKLSARDLLGIVVAIVGTIVLVVLAANCGDDGLQRTAGVDGQGTDGACVARNVIAGVTALINIAHVVGLMLFASVRYRGGFERLFSLMSLYGTPVAIVASALIA